MINRLLSPSRLGMVLLLPALLGGCQLWPFGRDEVPEEPPLASEQLPDQLIGAEVYRRDVKIAKVDTERFEIGAYSGILAVEDLSSSLAYGLRAGFLVTEDAFLEVHYLESSVTDQVRRDIGQPFFPEEDMDLEQYALVLGYTLFPGEVFVGRDVAMASQTYLLSGIGNTSFNGEDYLTYQFGFGFKLLPKDWMVVRIEARDSVWETDLLGAKKWTNNFEMNLGLGFIF